MTAPKPFPQAGFLHDLERRDESASLDDAALSPPLARILSGREDAERPVQAATHLIQLLKAMQAKQQAAFDTQQVADALRRYQKFAKPGQPSPHIVQLRQQQAAAGQASSRARQWLIQAAAAFVRDAGIAVPARVALEVFITQWIDTNVPKDINLPT